LSVDLRSRLQEQNVHHFHLWKRLQTEYYYWVEVRIDD
jgi:hypothetical protein